MDTTNTLDDKVKIISLLCSDPMTKILCKYINNKYKNHSIIKSYCDNKTLLFIYVDNKQACGYYPYFEIWNDTSEQNNGNAFSCTIISITKNSNNVTYNIETCIHKEEDTYETEHILKFNTGRKANEFIETDDNNEFYNFIEKFDTVSLVLRD